MIFERKRHLIGLLLCAGLQAVGAQTSRDFWELPPIQYSDTAANDKIAKLAGVLTDGTMPTAEMDSLGRLEWLLKYLDVPKESQVLVFSKTSLQNSRIHPENPRSLYFSENTYVGYVPGGEIEVIVHDAVLGPVFYLIKNSAGGALKIHRDTNRCMSCHATARTENVPGVLIRSVYPGEDGQPILSLGSHDVNDETPIEDRWGGWYVTGRSALPHLGNRQFDEDSDRVPRMTSLDTVSEKVDASRYLTATSDIVALMVLEHQVKLHSLLNAAGMNYRRSIHLMRALDPERELESESMDRISDGWAEDLVDALFFKNEADLGDGVEGSRDFQREFAKRFPKSSDGDSLVEFRLYRRIFKNRCSYMVYSDAFKGLPDGLKQRVIAKMKRVLSGEAEGFEYLKKSERKRIDEILSETLKGWK